MNTDQIAYLIDIAKTGSINTTAKRMFSSQQAVSEAIKRLEHELGCTILERSKRGVTLTEDGRFVLNHVIPMQEQYHALQQHFQERPATPAGTLHIGVASFATSILLTDLIFEMYHQYPHIALFTEELSISDIIADTLNGKIDFGIAGFSDNTNISLKQIETASLCIQPLYVDSIVCVMHRNNALSSEKEITAKHLEQIKFTSYSNYQNSDNLRSLLHVSSNTNIHKKFMQEENTVCLINSLAFKTLYPEKEYIAIPVKTISPITMALFYRKSLDNNENPIYRSFIQTALDLAKRLKQ